MHPQPDGVSDLRKAQADFQAARLANAAEPLRRLIAREAAPDAVLLLARIELRCGRISSALSLLSERMSGIHGRLERAEALLLSGVAFARLGDPSSAQLQFAQAQERLRAGDALNAELAYQRAAAAWIERDLETATEILGRLPATLDVDLTLQVYLLKGAIASAGENLAEQGALLLDALRRLRSSAAPNAYLHGMLMTHIAALALELPSAELRDAAAQGLAKVPWTSDISDLHFHAVRAIAWRSALDGDEFTAFRRLKDALSVTTSPAWRVAALADRAYLAEAFGERRWAAQELRDAHELASTIDWNAIAGEEKLALPILAQLFAARDPAVAMSYIATFKNVGHNYPRVLSSHADRRVDALEAYSLGSVQLELGANAHAQHLLLKAWEIYDHLGIRWRAARAALALARLADAELWTARAREALSPYPRSWLTRAARSSSGPPVAPPNARLTPAQQRVFDLLMEGRGTDEIAQTLGRSQFTVRNHVKAVLKSFGVSSRAALVARARLKE